MSDDPTLPPRQPNTPRVWIAKARAFAAANPDWMLAIVLIAFGAGALIF